MPDKAHGALSHGIKEAKWLEGVADLSRFVNRMRNEPGEFASNESMNTMQQNAASLRGGMGDSPWVKVFASDNPMLWRGLLPRQSATELLSNINVRVSDSRAAFELLSHRMILG